MLYLQINFDELPQFFDDFASLISLNTHTMEV